MTVLDRPTGRQAAVAVLRAAVSDWRAPDGDEPLMRTADDLLGDLGPEDLRAALWLLADVLVVVADDGGSPDFDKFLARLGLHAARCATTPRSIE